MKLSLSDKRFWMTAVIMALLTIAVLLVTDRIFSRRIEDLAKDAVPLNTDIMKNRSGKFRLDDNVREYTGLKKQVTTSIDELKTRLEFPFPAWVTPPNDAKAGEYFITMHSQRREDARTTCTMKGVQLLDGDLGFDRTATGSIIDRAKAMENLKSLSIVEKLIALLTDAKVTAIVKVSPEDSLLTGSYRMVDNPAYSEGSTQPKKKRVPNPPFIREYPVQIEIICDLTTLMKFLSSVRQEKQFLLVRDIAISADPPEDRKTAELMRPGEVYVTIAAAAMRFLSPEEHNKQVEQVRKTQQWLRPVKGPVYTEPMGF